MSYQFYDDVEKHYQLEAERNKVLNDPKYQMWVKELNISQSYVEPEGRIRANDLNKQYDYSKLSKRSSILELINSIF